MSRSRLQARAQSLNLRVMTKPVYIHAGAHRTGTSSFQLCLYQNRKLLADKGFDLAYPSRDGVRGGKLRMPLPRMPHGEKRVPQFARQLRDRLAKLSPDPARPLILSEENIPGPMRHFYVGRFFPASAKRLMTVAAALDGPPLHVIYVLRSYPELFASAFRKRSEDNKMPPFAEVVPRFLAMDRGWPDLVAQMRDLMKPACLTILPYERRGASRDLLSLLVPGLEGAALVEPDKTMNLSATDAGLAALQMRYHAGETLKEKEWRQVIADHAEDRAPRGYAAFSGSDAQVLTDRYHADLEKIAQMPGVRFL